MIKGKYLAVEKIDERLKISLLVSREEAETLLTEDSFETFKKLSEDIISENFNIIDPMKVGQFFEGVIIGEKISYDEDGEIIEDDDSLYYCFAEQENEDAVQALLDNGEVIFDIAE